MPSFASRNNHPLEDENKQKATSVVATKSWILGAPIKSQKRSRNNKNTTNDGNNDSNLDRNSNSSNKNIDNGDDDSNNDNDDNWHNVPINASLLTHKVQRFQASDEKRRQRRDDVCRPFWLGSALFLVLCAFWILDSLKDPVLGTLTNANLQVHQPRAKLLSVCTTLALVCFLEYITQQRQEQKQEQHQVTDSDILADDGQPWQKMEYTTRIRNNQINHDDNTHDSDKFSVINSNIFAYVGVPYCVAFGIMAYLLQFHPTLARSHVAVDETAAFIQEANLVASYNNNNNSNIDYPQYGSKNKTTFWYVTGYFFYAAIESFGSIAVATFWSYTNSTLCLRDAEHYYGPIIALAQLGAIVGSTMVTTHWWNTVTLIVVACLIMILHIVVMQVYAQRFPPTREQVQEEDDDDLNDQHYIPPQSTTNTTVQNSASLTAAPVRATWWTGVYLILQHNYVLYILGVSCLYEVSLTCLNYQMTLLGWNKFAESSDHSSNKMTFMQFMGHYGQMVNATSLLLSSFLFPVLIHRCGLKITLRVFPTLLLIVNVVAFGAVPGNLTVLFFSLSLLKAMTYSIHDPSKELLYVPTAPNIQFQAKFWIDVVGARVAKAIGSALNNVAGGVAGSIRVASAPSLLTAALLWMVCYQVGRQFEQLVAQKKIVGIHALDARGDVWLTEQPVDELMGNDANNRSEENDEGELFESPTSNIEMTTR